MGVSDGTRDSTTEPLLDTLGTSEYHANRPTSNRTNSSGGEKQCRICGDGEYESVSSQDDDEEARVGYAQASPLPRYPLNRHQQRLIRPCLCKGSMSYVHRGCLNQWRRLSPRSSSYVACDICGYRYNVYRPVYASIVTNIHFLRITTLFLVFASVIALAYAAVLVDQTILGHSPANDPNWEEWHGTVSFLLLDRFYLCAGIVAVALGGIVYLSVACIRQRRRPRHDDDDEDDCLPFFSCCDQSSCPWYSCYLADVAACGSGDAAAGGVFICLITVSMMAVLFGIVGAITGVYRCIETLVERAAGHLEEMILDVD
ncbi:hypothetical protein BC940DRAFT_301003 [Gongronella butleri]|nr:hypothetical protein BC940DRAFT_301003 [Gongronella butleri]